MLSFRPGKTLILHFQTSQEKRSTKGLLSFHRVAEDAVIRVYDDAGNVIETHEHTGETSKNGDASQDRARIVF